MKLLTITSPETLDVAVSEHVRLQLDLTEKITTRDQAIADIQKQHQADITAAQEAVAESETRIMDYCVAQRAALFTEKKSRGTDSADFGFELTPWRVETSSRKITWKDVAKRLGRVGAWAKVYLRKTDPKPDKEALLADRDKLTEEQQRAMGINFAQDEQFFIRPRPQTAAASAVAA